MADLYLKALESERRKLWAECRLKGLAKGTPERLRIDELDRLWRSIARDRAPKRSRGLDDRPIARRDRTVAKDLIPCW
jgi:hypothetical protein